MSKSLTELLNDPGSSVFGDAPRWTPDVDSMPSGLFTVSNSAKMPTTGEYCVISASGRATNNSRSAVQIAIASDGTASIRYFAGTWAAWAGLGGGGGASYAHAPWWDAANGIDPVLGAYATALGVNPPTTAQAALDILNYYAAANVSGFRGQLTYLYGGLGLANNLDHTVNPQTISLTGYNVSLITDGIGAFASNVKLPVGVDLLQRVELAVQFNHAGESVVIKPGGAGNGLMTAAGVDITTITISVNSKQVVLEWVQNVKKWRLIDYSDTGVTIV